MKQLSQILRTGEMSIIEVPTPEMGTREVLVRNIYSCVSAGTESSTVKTARKGYIGKAREKPAQLQQVIDTLKTQGPIQTYRAVMKKLDAYSPLGYSCVGRVIGVGVEVRDLVVGDYVACGGSAACHAEIVAVCNNLCVRVAPGVDLKQAAYNTVGAIAMQGVRQADVRVGEYCAVIGLGLIGQLTCKILRAAGVNVVGVDLNSKMVKMAGEHCVDLALLADGTGVQRRIIEFSKGMGCDSVIITAASDSLGPINFSGAIARKKGNIVIVGAVPTGFDREPHFYNKELSVKMSCSYGPGRYDPSYEEKNVDYPYGYVRWTEKRNMEAFQQLIAHGKIDLGYLTTHIFGIDDAPKLYDMIIDKSDVFAGILIEYDKTNTVEVKKAHFERKGSPKGAFKSKVAIGFLGAGSYAQSFLLPNIAKMNDVCLKGVVTRSSVSSRSVADRFGFDFCSTNPDDVLGDKEINVVFIASRHDTHGKFVANALKSGKNVFVEKPLCIRMEELEEITNLMEQRGDWERQPILMVGFNRRFSSLSSELKGKLNAGPKAMIYRINAGNIPLESWIQDAQIGGGRILGEVCHFIDYMTFVSESLPQSVYAATLRDSSNQNDTLSVSIRYQNGSLGSIHYFANGSPRFPKEYIEIYESETTISVNDFREMSVFGKRKPSKRKLMGQDKGQKKEITAFITAVVNGDAAPIRYEEIHSTSMVSFMILESIKSGRQMAL